MLTNILNTYYVLGTVHGVPDKMKSAVLVLSCLNKFKQTGVPVPSKMISAMTKESTDCYEKQRKPNMWLFQ